MPNAADPYNNNQGRPLADRDRDGVPNAADPYNNNQGRPLADRDRDGVPNAFDPRDDRWENRWGRVVAPPRYWGNRPGWNRHVRACFAAYRSYNPRTDSYIVRRGVTARCNLAMYGNNNGNTGRPGGDRDRDGVPNAYDPRDDRWNPAWGQVVMAPGYWGNRPGWNRHVAACFQTYRSYNPRTDRYTIRAGVTARCTL